MQSGEESSSSGRFMPVGCLQQSKQIFPTTVVYDMLDRCSVRWTGTL